MRPLAPRLWTLCSWLGRCPPGCAAAAALLACLQPALSALPAPSPRPPLQAEHPPPKGLEEGQLAALPATRLASQDAAAALRSHTCAVCLEAFEAGDTARVLPCCSNPFHSACVDPWLRSNAACPVCRAALAPPAAVAAAAAAAAEDVAGPDAAGEA